MGLWGKFNIPIYFMTMVFLSLSYSNCGQALNTFNNSYPLSSNNSKTEVFWPNETTTLRDSDQIISGITLSDLNNNGESSSVFLSDSESYASPIQNVIRVIDSETFAEQLNIYGMVDDPSDRVDMFLIDLDRNNSEKELLYIDEYGEKIIALNVFSDEPHVYRWKIDLFERLSFSNRPQISVKYINDQLNIMVGNNRIYENSLGNPQVVFSNENINGGWTPWSDWSNCSRTCGGGTQTRLRLCSSPVPRNGGSFCGGAGLDTRSCNTTTCNINCPAGTTLVIDRCVPDNPDASGQHSSVGGTGGGVSGGTGGTSGGGNCGAGMAYNAGTRSCVTRQQSCAVANGAGVRHWNGTGYGPCTDLMCFNRRVAVDNQCLELYIFRSSGGGSEGDSVQLSMRVTGSVTVKGLADRFCSNNGYLKSYEYVAGSRRIVNSNPDHPEHGTTHTIQNYNSITCAR